jgi:hypothetical protein
MSANGSFKCALFGAVVALFAAAMSSPASALVEADILGRWCGDSNNPNVTNLSFGRNQLTVTFVKDGAQSKFTVTSYAFTDTVVTMNWHRDDKKPAFTEYGEFSSDRRAMVQLGDARFPRYVFRRC